MHSSHKNYDFVHQPLVNVNKTQTLENKRDQSINEILHDPHELDCPLCDDICNTSRMTFHDLESQFLVL